MARIDPIEFARLQRQTANSYEQKMWFLLRNRQRCGFKFRRQHPLGPFTADFYSPEAKLNVEIDGDRHWTEAGRQSDARRDAWMNQHGIQVLRFSGKHVDFEAQSVCDKIDRVLKDLREPERLDPSPPSPLPAQSSEARGEEI